MRWLSVIAIALPLGGCAPQNKCANTAEDARAPAAGAQTASAQTAGAPAASGTPTAHGAQRVDEAAIAAMLDDWHDAAAKADEARYFGHLAEDSVFLGTDAKERWDKAAFLAYAHPHFAKGKAWSFRAARRAITFGGPDIAWFDEDLVTARLGPARGSGVAVRRGGRWVIAQYNLALTVPNERFEAVKKAIAGEGAAP
ncbi:MAG: nuclear transport factor 2 family protein [Minicystis sp.]